MNKLSHKIILLFAFLGLFIVCAGWSDGVREERSVTPASFNLSPHEAFLAAKSAVRQVMEEPLYWAGFIMLD